MWAPLKFKSDEEDSKSAGNRKASVNDSGAPNQSMISDAPGARGFGEDEESNGDVTKRSETKI
jgi:hypothetical protein